MNLSLAAYIACACTLAGVVAFAVCRNVLNRRLSAERRSKVLGGKATGGKHGKNNDNWVIAYAHDLTVKLLTGTTKSIFGNRSVESIKASRSFRTYRKYAYTSGYGKEISGFGFCEARARLALIGLLAGALFGFVISDVMAVVVGVAACAVGYQLLPSAFKNASRQRATCASLHLSEMLEIVGLGLRSGLTFDRSLALYGSYFDNDFARSCTKAYKSWTLGICTREEGLKQFAMSYDCPELSRIVDSITRSLRFGTALSGILSEAGSSARASYRASLEERVAKAPVKMMLPTGALILPAMLLLVLGPVLLELAGGF